MKKTLLVSSLVLGGLLVSTMTVNAEPGPHVENKTASVELGVKKGPGPYDGLLNITHSFDLQFGFIGINTQPTVVSTGSAVDKENKPLKAPTEPQTIVIEDIRGESSGWKVHVGLGEFKEVNDAGAYVEEGKVLKGVQLFFPNVELTTDGQGEKPVLVHNNDSFITKPAAKKGLVIDAADRAEGETGSLLYNAAEGTGDGKWTADYDVKKNPIELKIAPGNKIGKYQSKLVYTLTDTPNV